MLRHRTFHSLGFAVLIASILNPWISSRVASATVSPMEAAHLIICPASLETAFAPLALHRTQTGTPSALVTLEQVLATAPAGRDDAETLRNYLVQLRAGNALQFVLLGGSAEVLPVRWVQSTFYPAGGFTDLPADLYFSALDGDWDGDGDGILAEPYLGSTNPGDNADLDPDIALGRAPVTTPAQAGRFVQAVLTYEHPGQGAHVGSALLLAEVVFPFDWSGGPIQLDGAAFAEGIRTRLAGLASPVVSTRLYENFTAYGGSQPLTPAGAVSAMGSGLHGTVYYVGYGDQQMLSAASGPITLSQIDALSNAPNYFVAVAVSSSSAKFTDDSILEHVVLAPAGGGVGAIGFTDAAFASTASTYIRDLFVALTPAPGARLGEGWRTALHQHVADTVVNSSSRWTTLCMVLLGDPATPYRTEAGPVPARPASFGGLKQRFK